MARTALEILRYTRTEAWVEDLLFAHPELLSPNLPPPRRQVSFAGSRVDLLFEDEEQTVLVEIKRGVIDLAALAQMKRYRVLLKQPGRLFTGYLVGASISDEAAESLKKSGGRLKFRQIGRDIPREINLCQKCRRARHQAISACPFCGEKQILR
ncbi:uncharacterized protein DUF91 [Prosthecobacter fusiformis]|uniref:Uncharacterized protein DUF91 n=1 Tax=Prosthecobacter fusiformis TaxID=48464 RepID=A0A4R7S3G5_9BACT|nr:endonuclease NucS domain-containing protein [Prosthecobacter fusiformis]TDU72861.1 uncharacterized protein DUF91 [Prosthecobacter fusiformis]